MISVKKLLPIIGFCILLYLLSTIDIHVMGSMFMRASFIYTSLACFSIIPILLLSNIQWQMLLRQQKIPIRFWASLKNIFLGYFYGFITPGGLGAYIRSLHLSAESQQPLPKCVANIITFNTIDYITLLFFGAIGAVLLSNDFPYLFIPILILFVGIIALFVFFLTQKKSKILFSKIIRSQIFTTLQHHLDDPLDSFYDDLPSIRQVVPIFFVSGFGWLIRFYLLYSIAGLFSLHLPLLYGILMIAVADVVASLPISIYGLGTREATLVALFGMYQISRDEVLGLSLFWFAIVWLLPSIIGSGVAFIEQKKIDTKKILRST
ncbi:MAG: lysylphosphatidylglycerol synthase transmembrane domain-containing protein [Candidatus Thermoplasmatota archaeon]